MRKDLIAIDAKTNRTVVLFSNIHDREASVYYLRLSDDKRFISGSVKIINHKQLYVVIKTTFKARDEILFIGTKEECKEIFDYILSYIGDDGTVLEVWEYNEPKYPTIEDFRDDFKKC